MVPPDASQLPDIRRVSVDQLRLDRENPRFTARKDVDELSEFLEWFIEDADLIDLAASIATNGYFSGEPLLTAEPLPGAEDERLTVVEGNRRFAAVLLLLDPTLAPRRQSLRELSEGADLDSLRQLPCVIYSERDEILEYLGNRHIEGVKAWDPLAKARYLRQLRERAERHNEPTDDRSLARRIGSRADYVRRLLRSLAAFDKLADRHIVREDEARFSVLARRSATATSHATSALASPMKFRTRKITSSKRSAGGCSNPRPNAVELVWVSHATYAT